MISLRVFKPKIFYAIDQILANFGIITFATLSILPTFPLSLYVRSQRQESTISP
ncbi:hypothetical protein K445DRAFT_323484 [Daldinia sp. EC12]|nr:hypothetical protein K445DRAFT_323484 [Daldinia sp. EC12]